jgi:hypothetical protein
VWYGVTDAFGVARDSYGALPSLDPGTYYLKRHKPGYSFPAVDTEVVSCSAIIVADDSGSLSLDGAYNNCTLGGSVNRAWFNGSISSNVDFYTLGFATQFDGDEFTAIVRGKVPSIGDWGAGVTRSLLSVYSFPFGNDFTFDIPAAGGIIETTYMNSGFPPNLTRQVATTELGWMTLGVRGSNVGGFHEFYKDGLIQGASMGTPLWTRPIWVNGCYIGYLWKGWASDCIISFGVVATPAQMLAIHTKLDLGTLTTTDLNTIFGVGKYVWYRLNESP